MLYPIVDRRIAAIDRRTLGSRRKRNLAVGDDRRCGIQDRRSGSDRRQLKLDREKLLYNLRLPGLEDESPRLKLLRMIVLPVAIALISTVVTFFVNEQQRESSKRIAEAQIESAQYLAEADRKHAKNIADAEIKTRKLNQNINIFTEIIQEAAKSDEQGAAALEQIISSLQVYKDEALPFLLSLLHYQGGNEEKTVRDSAKISIEKILSKSQLELPIMTFQSEDEESQLNLRHRNYAGYNLSKSTFQNVNLFKANFSDATLISVQFKSVDLAGANFKNANLQNAKFIETELAETTFDNTYLKGAKFNNCNNLDRANFSLKILLRPEADPVKSFNSNDYVALLSRHIDKLRD